uniref:Uncharacterized protein n=2 Tax=unclassified Caudoviricetes TaxID=2788787 RepID=A0A8S5PT61_9CAUD|nr:MAG TPA: hypothetical protein [Siphoviridae sp. ctPxx43]DAE10254.1 MAG TPA: hypothetical protein [Siphoviridae sp. ct0yh16]
MKKPDFRAFSGNLGIKKSRTQARNVTSCIRLTKPILMGRQLLSTFSSEFQNFFIFLHWEFVQYFLYYLYKKLTIG